MGDYFRDRSGGDRGGYQSRGRSSYGGGGRSFSRGGDRQMFKTICSNCGKECEVPFRPTNGKPVYCSDCFEKMGGRSSGSPRPERSDFRAPGIDQNKNQLDAISSKLDRIINLLEPKVSIPVFTAPDIKEVKEIKAPKAAKASKKPTSKKKK